jgi:hypothetical protein
MKYKSMVMQPFLGRRKGFADQEFQVTEKQHGKVSASSLFSLTQTCALRVFLIGM